MPRTWTNDDRTGEWGEACRSQMRQLETDLATTTALAQGGGTVGAAILHGPFTFNYNTGSLNNGVSFYTPTVGDVMVAAVIDRPTAWNSNFVTSRADIGQFTSTLTGLYNDTGVNPGGFHLADTITTNNGIRYVNPGLGEYGLTYIFTTTDPLLFVASQDGTKGGTAISGATQGQANVYILVAHPVTP